MSTDAPITQTPDMATKKKKDKSSTEKKRKREEEQQDGGAEDTVEPAKKKSKKVKHQADPVVLPTPIASNGSAGAATPATTAKKPKKVKQEPKEESVEIAAIPEATPAKKRKKKDTAHTDTPAHQSSSRQPQGLFKPEHHNSAAEARNPSPEQLLEKHSPFETRTQSFYLTLSPCANDFPLEGLIAEHLSPLILSYYPPLKGVVMGIQNARLSETPHGAGEDGEEAEVVLAKAVDEYAVTYVWLTAEFTLFRPRRGSWMEGYVNLQNESLLGLVCYNYFNAGIEFQRLPKDWRWVAAEGGLDEGGFGGGKRQQGNGYWVNGNGVKVEGRLVFRVCDFEAAPGGENGGGSVSIHGTLLSEEDERKVEDEERQRGLIRQRKR